ncbi:unnamed protein product [Brachionus calyciflorus]|uniref:EGF-like domain-containing protein n=1 Tax=Brachionus calyciflorus TaxID=104777 RepID=A0A813RBY6_9BILA|nr:unnamed protein product [Brachionus calyciflorus]
MNKALILLALIAIGLMTVTEAGKNSKEKNKNKNPKPGKYQEDCSYRRCSPEQGTICLNGTCSCNATETWNGRFCDRHLSLCSSENYCRAQGYQCLNGVCECPTGETWNGKFCSRYSAPCNTTGNFRYCSVQGLKCVSGVCDCALGKWNETASFCALSNGELCFDSKKGRGLFSGEKSDNRFRTQCDTGLYCQKQKRSRTCQCISPTVWDGAACV